LVALFVVCFPVLLFCSGYNSMRVSIVLLLVAAMSLPVYAVEQVTVQQLEQKMSSQPPPPASLPLQAVRDDQLAQLVGNFVLTERLSDARLERISRKLQAGRFSKQALQVLAYGLRSSILRRMNCPHFHFPTRRLRSG
jgi:hypothetical protein